MIGLGSMCECTKNVTVVYWHTGKALCIDCFNEWKTQEDEGRKHEKNNAVVSMSLLDYF